jgi:hypothetical protein
MILLKFKKPNTMKNIISISELHSIAFCDGGYIPQDVISESDIMTATERWVIPITGRKLMEAVAQGKYPELRQEYIAPTIALYTRVLVQPRLNAMSGVGGLTTAGGSQRKAAEESLRKEYQSAIRSKARALLRALSEELNRKAKEIAEYDPKENILNRCCCDGGFVQVY